MTRLEFNISFKKHRTDIQTFGKISFVQVYSLVVKVLASMAAVKKKSKKKSQKQTNDNNNKNSRRYVVFPSYNF